MTHQHHSVSTHQAQHPSKAEITGTLSDWHPAVKMLLVTSQSLSGKRPAGLKGPSIFQAEVRKLQHLPILDKKKSEKMVIEEKVISANWSIAAKLRGGDA